MLLRKSYCNVWFFYLNVTFIIFIYLFNYFNCFCRVLNIWPVRFMSSKLSTCVQAGYRTDHFQTVFSTRKATRHMDFMRYKPFIFTLVFISVQTYFMSGPWRVCDSAVCFCLSAGRRTCSCPSLWT